MNRPLRDRVRCRRRGHRPRPRTAHTDAGTAAGDARSGSASPASRSDRWSPSPETRTPARNPRSTATLGDVVDRPPRSPDASNPAGHAHDYRAADPAQAWPHPNPQYPTPVRLPGDPRPASRPNPLGRDFSDELTEQHPRQHRDLLGQLRRPEPQPPPPEPQPPRTRSCHDVTSSTAAASLRTVADTPRSRHHNRHRCTHHPGASKTIMKPNTPPTGLPNPYSASARTTERLLVQQQFNNAHDTLPGVARQSA